MAIWEWRPSRWVGLAPNGIGSVKPNHYKDLAVHAWRNRKQLPFAWRILNDGVCDGCALGTTGLHDWTMTGRTCACPPAAAAPEHHAAPSTRRLADVESLARLTVERACGTLGRLPYPMLRRRGDPGFRRISWDEALDPRRRACARRTRSASRST